MFIENRQKRDVANRSLSALFLLGFLVMISAGDCLADRSVRCDGRFVSVGAMEAEVEELCGTPTGVREWEEGYRTAFSERFDYVTEHYILPRLVFGPIHMACWTYDFGSNRLIHHLYFKNGELIRIETGDRGRN